MTSLGTRLPRPFAGEASADDGPRTKILSAFQPTKSTHSNFSSKTYEAGLSDLTPPRQLSILARQTIDRHAARTHAEGRWKCIDVDPLCSYCECVETYLGAARAGCLFLFWAPGPPQNFAEDCPTFRNRKATSPTSGWPPNLDHRPKKKGENG